MTEAQKKDALALIMKGCQLTTVAEHYNLTRDELINEFNKAFKSGKN